MSRPASVTKNPTRTLVVVCSDWPLTAARASAAGPASVTSPSQAVAVSGNGRIVAASSAAQAEGIRHGQRRREAQARCPHLVLLERDPANETRLFVPVIEALEAFGALVAVREPGWAGFATRGPARYFGGEAALRDAVDASLARLDLPGEWWRVGIGDGPFVATRAAERRLVVEPGRGAELLAPLEVEVLGRPELADVLRRLGIETLGAFAKLGEREILARFGIDGATAHRLARGLDEEPLHVRPRREDLSVSAVLDPPAEGVEVTAFMARGLAEQLGARLAAAGLACARLRVEALTTGGEQLVCTWSNNAAIAPAVVAERLRWQLESWLLGRAAPPGSAGSAGSADSAGSPGSYTAGEVAPGQGVERVTLVPEEVHPDVGRQLGLWSRPREGGERLARAVARIQALLGPAAVVQPELGGGRGPVERVRLATFDDPVGAVSLAPWPGRIPAPSPAVVARGSFAVELLGADGSSVAVDGRGAMSSAPVSLVVGSAPRAPVLSWAGPWPADERWWEGTSRRRRVRVQVVTEKGAAYLLVLEQGRWLVEGAYD